MGNTGRLLRSDDPKRKIAHGLPPVEQLAATLRNHLERAGVKRRSLYTNTTATKQITFYDLRATGITWLALEGCNMQVIMKRAGHEDPKTSLLYIREAESVGEAIGMPFPELPESLKRPRERAARGSGKSDLASKKLESVASPTGRSQY